MNSERNNLSMSVTNETTANEKETTTDEKRDKRDWIDRDFYTEHGGEG